MKTKLLTYYKLGLANIAIVALYRILKKLGYYQFKLPVYTIKVDEIFSPEITDNTNQYEATYFSYHKKIVSSPPNWHQNPWNKQLAFPPKSIKRWGGVFSKISNDSHWSKLPDFSDKLGDIKLVWEMSRFDWLPVMAWEYKNGDKTKLPLLELWLRDWLNKNPINEGVNWKCGQEASFRCINLILTSFTLDKGGASTGLLKTLEAHLDRISPTLHYAMAQDNNHGSSEAAALFIAGEFLAKYGVGKKIEKGIKYSKKGRFYLENRVARLVMEDGSFSQYSITYHRLFLDCLSFVELTRVHLGLAKFSQSYYEKMSKAVIWLFLMTDETSGDAPNLGANDGAYLFNLERRQYRDFRPSINLGAAAFLKYNVYQHRGQHPLLAILKTKDTLSSYSPTKPKTSIFKDGGYALLFKSNGLAMMRLPVYKFRPSHADAHHIDIWHKGENIICDAGSYSYNTDEITLGYFSGTESHSTIQFDNRDQMPRLGRFLFANWLTPNKLTVNNANRSITSEYSDYQGATHNRTITHQANGWLIIDKIDNFKNNAIIRWRLNEDSLKIEGATVTGKLFTLTLETDLDISITLEEKSNSLYYMQKDNAPVLKACLKAPGTIKTVLTFL